MTETTTWWALGKVEEPARAIVTGTREQAETSLLPDEVCAALAGFPTVQMMIGADGLAAEVKPSLAQLKLAKSDAVKAARDAHLDGGCVTPFQGKRVDTDDASRTNISGSVTMAMLAKSAGQPFALSWRMSENTSLDLNADMMIGLGVTVGQFVSATYAASFAVLDGIAAATTVEEVQAIDLDAIAWPGSAPAQVGA